MMQDEAMLIAYFLTYYPIGIGRLWGTKIIIDGLDGDGNGVSVRKLGRSEMSMVDVAAHRIYDAKK